MVNRKRYEEWERAVVHEFWDPAKARTKAKVLVVCDSLGDYKTKAASYATMYHIGKGCPDRVKVGTENGTVFYPATDTGGLTNYKVKEGERPRFEGKALRPEDGANVYREWKRLSGKRRVYGGVADRLEKWLASCPAFRTKRGWSSRRRGRKKR